MSADRLLIIVEDDDNFAKALRRSFERRGYEVIQAASLEETAGLLESRSPGYAVVDLKLGAAKYLS